MKKVLSAIVTVVLIAWVGLMGYDYYRATKNQKPVVVLKEEVKNYSDGKVYEYTSLGYKYIVYKRSSRTGYMFGGFWITAEED